MGRREILCGVFLALLGVGGGIVSQPEIQLISYWVGWGCILISLTGLAVLLFRRPKAETIIEERVPVSQALAFMIMREWNKSLDDAAPLVRDGSAMADELRRFEQYASDNRFRMWGRLTQVGLSPSALETLVPTEHWETHQLNYLSTHLLGEAETAARIPRTHGSEPVYKCLRVEKREFERAFPAKQ